MSDAANNPGTVPDQSHPSIPPDATIILPVRNTLLFPGTVLPLTIGRPASIAAAQEAVRSGGTIALLLQDPFTMMNPLMKGGAHIEEMLADRPEFAARAARGGRTGDAGRLLERVQELELDIAHRPLHMR